jgi:hypothetical protein
LLQQEYPQHIMIGFTQDQMYLSEYAVGELVRVSINLRGREVG